MLRLFVGIEIPAAHRLRLSLVSGPLPGAKWVERESLHLTLRFAGEIENHVADEFADFLAQIAADPFEVTIKGLDAFGGREPRAIYAAVAANPALEHLQRAIERAARNAGLPPETRAFTPHVTLARLKGTSPEQVARFLGECGALTTEPFPVARFVLMSSRPRTGGGPYVVEAAYSLGSGDG